MSDVIYVDGIGHYTTAAQGATKAAASGTPVAAAGAFGAYGILISANEQINYAQTAEREISIFFLISATPGVNGGTDSPLLVIFDSAQTQLWITAEPDGSLKVYGGGTGSYSGVTWQYYGTLLGTTTAGTVQFGVHNHFKIKVLHHASAGTVDIELNGVSILALTGKNTAYSGNAYSTNIRIGYTNSMVGDIRKAAPPTGYFSHLLIADAIGIIAGQPRIGALFPNGVGATSAWTPSAGSNYANVDETTPNDDTDYNESSTVGHVDTYTMQDTPALLTISGLAVTVRIKRTDANSYFVAAVLRIGGVDYVHPTPQGVPGDYAYLQWIWTVSPATSVAFTASEVNGLEAGIKVTS